LHGNSSCGVENPMVVTKKKPDTKKVEAKKPEPKNVESKKAVAGKTVTKPVSKPKK
jgi:hypothetical protein